MKEREGSILWRSGREGCDFFFQGNPTQGGVFTLSPFYTSRMLICTHNRGIDPHPFHVRIFSQCVENHLPHILVYPAFKALMSAFPLPALPGQRAPLPRVSSTQITPSTKRRLSSTGRPTVPEKPGKLPAIRSH